MNGGLIWLAVLAVLGAAAVMVVRRMSRLAARTRDLERFQHAALDLELRFKAIADPLIASLDEGRRRAVEVEALLEMLSAATDGLRAVAAQSRAAVPPPALSRQAAGLVYELDRAVRAAELAGHSLGSTPERGAGPDGTAGTAVKRGALNLRHARDSIRSLVAEIVAVRPADLAQIAAARSAAPKGPPGMYIVDDGGAEESFGPRM